MGPCFLQTLGILTEFIAITSHEFVILSIQRLHDANTYRQARGCGCKAAWNHTQFSTADRCLLSDPNLELLHPSVTWRCLTHFIIRALPFYPTCMCMCTFLLSSLTAVYEVRSTEHQIFSSTQREAGLFEVLFLFLKSWFFALRFITQVSPNYQQLISWQETAALPLLLCWTSPSGDIIRRVWCFLSSQQDNNCFPSVTQNYVKSLASIFAMSTQEILEDPCLNSH